MKIRPLLKMINILFLLLVLSQYSEAKDINTDNNMMPDSITSPGQNDRLREVISFILSNFQEDSQNLPRKVLIEPAELANILNEKLLELNLPQIILDEKSNVEVAKLKMMLGSLNLGFEITDKNYRFCLPCSVEGWNSFKWGIVRK